MSLTSPRRSALVDQVIDQLRGLITSGAWPVGTRIPTESELVVRLGVARNTVREAVRALAHNGLLDIRQGSGTHVVATSELAGVMHRRFASADPGDIAELRSTLEAEGARLAARRRTERQLHHVERLLARREAAWAAGDAERFVEADTTLHLAIVTASQNEVLTALYSDLTAVLRTFLRIDVGEKLAPEEHVDHERLVAAIREGDEQTAAREAASYALQCRSGDIPVHPGYPEHPEPGADPVGPTGAAAGE